MRNVIVGVQGASAAGKSTLAGRLAAELGGSVVHELAESADWTPGTVVGLPSNEQELLANRRMFLDYECRRWARATSLAETRPAVFDTEWIEQLLWGLHDLEVTHPAWDRRSLAGSILEMYGERAASRALGCCDAIVLLDPSADVVRRQRDGDTTRMRRNFERNLRVATLMRPTWGDLQSVLGERLMIAGDCAAFRLPDVAPWPDQLDPPMAMRVLDAIISRFRGRDAKRKTVT